MTWQPIETAPKDGTTVRVNGPHELYPMDATYSRAFGGWMAAKVLMTLGPAVDIADPTHWMPLPGAPNEQIERLAEIGRERGWKSL